MRVFDSFNWFVKRFFACLFVFCFVFMVLFAPVLVGVAHAAHEHDVVVVCRNTGMSECDCESDAQLRFVVSALSGVRVFSDSAHFIEIRNECYICAIMHKSVNPLKFSCIASCSTILSDSGLFGSDCFDLDCIRSVSLTPVELRIKLTN